MTTRAPEFDRWLGCNILHTTCMTSGKQGTTIINSGNTENLVSQEIVEKLGLKTKRLNCSYNLAWFNEGSKVPIKFRCLFHFFVGKVYKDTMWCDVAPLGVSYFTWLTPAI